jgi:hypothetical protein
MEQRKLAGAALVALAITALGGASGALGAPPAESGGSFPTILLQGPGWRVQHENMERSREGIEGSVEFVTGKPIPYEAIKITGPNDHPRESGMLPAAVRQRRVELDWRNESLATAVARERSGIHPHGQKWVELPVLGTTAQVDTRAEFFTNQGGPGNRQMTAFWEEDGRLLEARAAVPDQAAFEERLAWLTKVDEPTWLAAMPATAVIPADHDAAITEMLKGIPVPKTFKPSRVPDEGLPTARYQVGANVTGTVACLWFRQWGEAQRSGDMAAEEEAVTAMATSKHWAVLHEMDAEGDYPEVLWELAAAMPSGVWTWDGKTHPLLPHAEGLGCARKGIPLLPKKIKAQHERDTTARA